MCKPKIERPKKKVGKLRLLAVTIKISFRGKKNIQTVSPIYCEESQRVLKNSKTILTRLRRRQKKCLGAKS